MKKYRFSLIILVVLIVVALIFFFSNKYSTIKKELRDFAIEDTSSVDKIFMVTKANEKALLEKIDGEWKINGKYTVRKDAINLLLKTINRVDIKSPVSKASFENVVKGLATQSTKVEIYQNKKLSKVFYVGGPTPDNMGTFMMIENSSTPFVCHIPGFSGFLSTRFFIEESLWREQCVYSYQYKDIKSIQVDYPPSPVNSFIIEKNGPNNFEMEIISNKSKITNLDTTRVKEFFGAFKKLNFEAIVTKIPQEKRDSILNAVPAQIFTVTDTKGNKNQVKTFLRKNMGLVGDDGKEYVYDPDRLYALLPSGDLVIIQYYSFNDVIKLPSYFQR